MTDFSPAFAANGDRRAPTTDEQSLGFPCGPADRQLFNYLAHLMQGQIKNIADEAGVTSGSEGDLTVLYRAVDALIDAATGGNPAGYILMTQARARLPIFPDVQNADGRIVVTSPSTGTVRIPGGVTFNHRGIYSVTTAQEDFVTEASKTYHIRWNPDDGFSINDLSDNGYNPSSLSETNTAFDSAYDDMLVARVVTNSSNVATITNLANKARLESEQTATGSGVVGSANSASYSNTFTVNWARTPFAIVTGHMNGQQVLLNGYANAINKTVTRYSVAATVTSDWNADPSLPAGELILQALR